MKLSHSRTPKLCTEKCPSVSDFSARESMRSIHGVVAACDKFYFKWFILVIRHGNICAAFMWQIVTILALELVSFVCGKIFWRLYLPQKNLLSKAATHFSRDLAVKRAERIMKKWALMSLSIMNTIGRFSLLSFNWLIWPYWLTSLFCGDFILCRISETWTQNITLSRKRRGLHTNQVKQNFLTSSKLWNKE